MDHATKVHQIYDKTVKRCFSLSSRSTINLINGLYERDYPLDSQVLYNWTEHTDDDLKRTLADTIITITTAESSQSYHVEMQMDEDRSIVLRIFEYGFGHALKSRTDEETDVLHFPEPLVIYLYQDKELPPFRELTIDFGDQGSFRYRVTAINYLSMPLEELNRRKLIVLIPFQLLKLRKEIEKKRTPENLDALKKLIKDDILGSIQVNLDAGNISKDEERKLRRMTLRLYHHLYDQFEEMEESGVNQMVEDALILDIDIIEHEHKMAMQKLEQELKQELKQELGRKNEELSKKDDILKAIAANLRRDGKTESEILQIMALKKEELDALEA